MILNKVMALGTSISAQMGGILLTATAFLDIGLQWASAIVAVGGAVLFVMGLIDFAEGKSQHNPNAKQEGLNKMVGGIAIILVGIGLVPQIRNMFPG